MQTKPMKAFYKVKRAQQTIEPIIGRDSLLGLIFQLFEGLKDLFDPATTNRGLKTLKFVEEKMLQFFEGDDRNPYFEAVYVSLYHYYNAQRELPYVSHDDSGETAKHLNRQIVHYLEKNLKIQLIQYGKYHHSVLQTMEGLADAYFNLSELLKSKQIYLEVIEIA